VHHPQRGSNATRLMDVLKHTLGAEETQKTQHGAHTGSIRNIIGSHEVGALERRKCQSSGDVVVK
jgi:hypothetical protein